MSRWTEWTPEICDKAIDLAAMGIGFAVEARTRGDAARLRALLIDRICDRGIGARVDPPDEYGNVIAKVFGKVTDGTLTVSARLQPRKSGLTSAATAIRYCRGRAEYEPLR